MGLASACCRVLSTEIMNVFRRGFSVVNICCCTCRRVLVEVSWSAEDTARVRSTAKQSQGTAARFTSLNQRAPVLFTNPHGERDLSNCIFGGSYQRRKGT